MSAALVLLAGLVALQTVVLAIQTVDAPAWRRGALIAGAVSRIVVLAVAAGFAFL